MGFTAPVEEYRLNFEDPKWAGLEVVCRGVSVQEMLDMTAWEETRRDQSRPAEERNAATVKLIDLFATALISWNLEDKKGNEIPATPANVWAQDISFIMLLLAVYRLTVAGVLPPLSEPSSDGEQLAEESIPMDVLSESLLS